METITQRNVQFGCGLSCPEGWINYDASPTLRLQGIPVLGSILLAGRAKFPKGVRFGDITDQLPEQTNSVDNLYCSHVLEHLSLEDFRHALKESHRILKPGGTFRLVMPDLEKLAQWYLNTPGPGASIKFMQHSLLGIESRPKTVLGRLKESLGNSRHLWLWDHQSAIAELEKAGFVEVRRCEFGDSPIAAFDLVEAEDRFNDAVAIQASRL